MSVISIDTAWAIAKAHQEIKAATALLKTLTEAKDRREIPHFRDAFGRLRGLTLGVPSGENATTCYDVSAELAVYVIEAHIARKHTDLAEASVRARMELDGEVTREAQG